MYLVAISGGVNSYCSWKIHCHLIHWYGL